MTNGSGEVSWPEGRKGKSSSGKSVCLRKATMIASSSIESTVDFASFGPVFKSATEPRFFHLATVLGLMPYRLERLLRLS